MMNIALSAVCFHADLFSGRMRQADVPTIAMQLGFDAVELLDLLAVPLPAGRWTGSARRLWKGIQRHLPWLPARPGAGRPKRYSPAVATPLRGAADRAGVRIIAWTLDTDLTAQGAVGEAQRAYWGRGVATARALGASVLRVTSGGAPTGADLQAAQQGLRDLVKLAGGLMVAVENHRGLSSDPARLAALVAAAPGAGVCLDFGNFDPAIREAAVLSLVPHTVHVHAKALAFTRDGAEATLPYHRFVPALQASGYGGWYSIEYEGDGPAEEGIKHTQALLERVGAG